MATILLKTKHARKDHFCDGSCVIKRIHEGDPYFTLREGGQGRFWTAKKYHPFCLPVMPSWLERQLIFQQRKRNNRVKA